MIGALLAVHRTVRPFPPGEVSLLMSFAAHAAVALENAQLFEQLDRANRQVRAAGATPSRSPRTAHDRLTDVLLHGGGVAGGRRGARRRAGADRGGARQRGPLPGR